MADNLEQAAVEPTKGGFLQESLSRTNSQIRKQRGGAIAEELEMTYKRHIEDLQYKLRKETREQTDMFDFSPDNAQSLVLAKDVSSTAILEDDMKASLSQREIRIRLTEAQKRYNFLFGETYNIEE